jgi:hypothetical protein
MTPLVIGDAVNLRKLFQRDIEYDTRDRLAIAAEIEGVGGEEDEDGEEEDEAARRLDEGVGREEEEKQEGKEAARKLVRKVQLKLGALDENKFTPMATRDPLVAMSCIFVPGQSVAIGRASTVLDVSVAEAAAWELSMMSRETLRTVKTSFGSLERSFRKTSKFSRLFYAVYVRAAASSRETNRNYP